MAAVKKTLQLYRELEVKLQDERQILIVRLGSLDKKSFVVVAIKDGEQQDEGLARADNSNTSITNATQIHFEITDLKLKYVKERIVRLGELCSENPKSPTPDELSYDRYFDFVERNQRIVQLSLRLYDLEKLKYDLKQRNSIVINHGVAGNDFVAAESIQRIQLLIQRHKSAPQNSTRRYIQELVRPQGNRKTLESTEVQSYVAECLQNAGSPTNAAGQQIGAAPTRYRSFLEVLTNYIVQKQRESQNEELEYNVVYSVLEAEVMPQIKDVAWLRVAEGARDDIIKKQCERFADVTMKQLRVKPSLQSKELVPYIGCIAHLRATCFYPNPTDKMYSVVAAAKALYDQLGNTKDLSIDGDSFLDLWVYAILKANIPDAVSNLQFMKEYGNPRLGNDEAGYYLTTMEAALLFIESLTPEKIVRIMEPLEFIVTEFERFLRLSELQVSCMVVVRSKVKLEGYIVAAVKDWILDRSRLYRCVLVYTGSPQDVATVSVVRLEQEQAAASVVEHVQEIFLKPPRKGLQCVRMPQGHAVVANLTECAAQDFVVWPANRTWTDLEYMMELIHTGSEHSDPTLNRKEGIPVSRRTQSGSNLSHTNEPADLFAGFGSYNPHSYVSVGLPVQELKPFPTLPGPRTLHVTVKADVHVEEDGGRGGGRRGETVQTSRPAALNNRVDLSPREMGAEEDVGVAERHAPVEPLMLEASKEFWSPENQTRLERNFAKNHLGEGHVRDDTISKLKGVVRCVQLDLQRLGHLSLSCPLDGQCTTEVQRAILHFQSAHNSMGKVVWPLPENGYLTKATRVELRDQFLSLYGSLTSAMGREIDQNFDPDSTNPSDIKLFRDSVAQFQTANNVCTCQKGALCEQTVVAIKSCMRQSVRHTF